MIRFRSDAQLVRDLLYLGAEYPRPCELLCQELLDYRHDPESVAIHEPVGVGLRHCVVLEVYGGSRHGIPLAAQVVLRPIPDAETRVLAAAPHAGPTRVSTAEILANQRLWSLQPAPLAPPAIPLGPLSGADDVLRIPNVSLALTRAKDRAVARAFGDDAEFEWLTVRTGRVGGERGEEGAVDFLLCRIFRRLLIVSMGSAEERLALRALAQQVWEVHERWLMALAQVLVPSRGAQMIVAPPLSE